MCAAMEVTSTARLSNNLSYPLKPSQEVINLSELRQIGRDDELMQDNLDSHMQKWLSEVLRIGVWALSLVGRFWADKDDAKQHLW